ncbi:PLP-dependent aminotransferase family protein [Luteibacter jiangsuensis]|uniref:PLP-dependent aminotransferase family protein n=1 Tax=Luteibacter jiangsuensis TaxID=637577 RepID=A0ABX0Q4G5_9GAMM|nr:PLP-dependent aminotransferase family protein [Luteibacter jiangsuensis]NID04512.1 PLP-dependent aminotransferase family protein [Luteibacter jiangsuensis]
MPSIFEIAIDLPTKGSRRAADSVYGQLRRAILAGRLVAGARLPPERESAIFFGVSRNTVARAYARLAMEGLVMSRQGAGTFIAPKKKQPPHPHHTTPSTPDRRLNALWRRPEVLQALNFWQDKPRATSSEAATSLDFRPALVDPRLFPFDVFRRVTARQLRRTELKRPRFDSPQGNQGHFPLRKAIATHVGASRAVVCEPEDILVTAGAQQAFDLLARVLVTPGVTTVAAEDPGYPPMRAAFLAAGARVVPIPVDEQGLVVDALPSSANIVCVCPSHQFPSGVTMSAQRRLALHAFARQHGAVIVEDDYDGEFRYDGEPLQSLRSTAPASDVFYVGTFSKCMLPALRLGFLVAPPWAMPALTTAKNCLDWHCPTLTQAAVAHFIAEGHLARHVRKLRGLYKERRDLICEILRAEFAESLLPVPSFYGMHVGASSLLPARRLERVTRHLLGLGVQLHSFERYFVAKPTCTGLVLGYGTADLKQIEQGLSLLRQAI